MIQAHRLPRHGGMNWADSGSGRQGYRSIAPCFSGGSISRISASPGNRRSSEGSVPGPAARPAESGPAANCGLTSRGGGAIIPLSQKRILRNRKKGGSGVEKQRRGGLILCVLAAVLVLLIFVSFLLGRYPVSPGALLGVLLHRLLRALGGLLSPLFPSAAGWGLSPFWDGSTEAVAWNIRLPRILLSCMVGCCLSIAGASFQGVFQNPMASPDILGPPTGRPSGRRWPFSWGGAASSSPFPPSAFPSSRWRRPFWSAAWPGASGC